jgi:hypothetical protein
MRRSSALVWHAELGNSEIANSNPLVTAMVLLQRSYSESLGLD